MHYLQGHLPNEELPLIVLVIAANLLAKHAVLIVASAQPKLPKALQHQSSTPTHQLHCEASFKTFCEHDKWLARLLCIAPSSQANVMPGPATE